MANRLGRGFFDLQRLALPPDDWRLDRRPWRDGRRGPTSLYRRVRPVKPETVGGVTHVAHPDDDENPDCGHCFFAPRLRSAAEGVGYGLGNEQVSRQQQILRV